MVIWSDNDPESEYSQTMRKAKSVNSSNFWTEMRKVFAHDIDTLDLDRFKVWASTMIIPLFTIKPIQEFYSIVSNVVPEDKRYDNALCEPFVGCTEEDFNNHLRILADKNYSANRIQLLSHLLICGWNIEKLASINSIIEIGAGIGEMTDIIYKLGFNGKYSILDFPEIHTLQKHLHDRLEIDNVEYVTDLNNLPVADLGIACFSFTEMPIEERDKIIDHMALTKNWLIVYSKHIFGIDNESYIHDIFLKKFQNHNIKFFDVPFMNWDGGTRYLSITQKES
jgi:hypothetical protein